MNKSSVAVAFLLGLFTCNLWAARICGEGDVGVRGVSPYDDPIENRECVLMGLIYCRIAEDRDDKQDQKYAVSETTRWLSGYGQTGSHTTVNSGPMVAAAGEFIYQRKDISALSMFYQSVYACGAKLRLAKNPQEQALTKQFADASTKCQEQFPGKAGATRNDQLRDCLHEAVDQLPKK